MFGSVDNPDDYTSALEKNNATYRLHIDGALWRICVSI